MKNCQPDYFRRMGEYFFDAQRQLLNISLPPGFSKPTKGWNELDELEQKHWIGLAIVTLPVHDFAKGVAQMVPKMTLKSKA